MQVIKIKKNKVRNIYTEKLKVAAYIRVSTKLDAQISSFESQYIYYKQLIERNANWKFVDIYYDYGISGKKAKNREGFQKLVCDCENGNIDLILTKSISRFSRNTVDSLAYVRKLKYMGIGVIFEEEHINTLELGGEMLLSIFSSIAQIESENASLRQSYGYYMSVKNKTRAPNMIPYGYKYNKKTRKVYLNKKEAKIVKEMFEVYNESSSIKKTKDMLDSKAKPKKGESWSAYTIRRMLNNRKYLGEFILRSIDQFDNDVEYKISIPKIIDDSLFNMAQEKLRLSREHFSCDGKNDYSNEEFYGKIKCGYCNCAMNFRNKYSLKNEILICPRSGLNLCACKTISKDILKRVVNGLFKELLNHKDINLNIKNITSSIETLQVKKSNLEIEKSIFMEKYLNKEISILEFNEKLKTLELRINQIQLEINNKENEREQKKSYRKIFLKVLRKISKNYKKEFNNSLFNEVVSYAFMGTTNSNNSKAPYNFRFIYDSKYRDGKIPKEELERIKTIKIIEYKYFINLRHISNDKKKIIKTSYVTITYEIRND